MFSDCECVKICQCCGILSYSFGKESIACSIKANFVVPKRRSGRAGLLWSLAK